MNELIIFLLGAFVGALGTYFVMRSRQSSGPSHGIGVSVEKQHFEKQSRKQKILELLKERGNVTNNDVEVALSVSDASATNYLQELEREGKIEQIGEQGRFVSYRLKQ